MEFGWPIIKQIKKQINEIECIGGGKKQTNGLLLPIYFF
jgi:hypothetical protein